MHVPPPHLGNLVGAWALADSVNPSGALTFDRTCVVLCSFQQACCWLVDACLRVPLAGKGLRRAANCRVWRVPGP